MSQKSNCTHVHYIDYGQTASFSKIALDYIQGQDSLKPFYQHSVDPDGVKAAIKARAGFSQSTRQLLADQFAIQYKDLAENEPVLANIQALREENTFTITTAHQPNILGGPLFLVYKIIHVIKLAQELNETNPGQQFIPVYYMGSEDADLEELNHIQVEGKAYAWETDQTGAVGRMLVDDQLLRLIEELSGQIGVTEYGPQLIDLFRDSYQKGRQIQEATLHLMHGLFGRFGLLVLIPDNAVLKRIFEPAVLRELKEQCSHNAVESKAAAIAAAGYKVQTHGREINLFYLTEDHRERIEQTDSGYAVPALGLQFTPAEIESEVKLHPERFSGNVVLRGPFQETILPNIIFVGGGGELAYWLEMKGVYDELGIPYPLLLLRNSFTLINQKQSAQLRRLGLGAQDFFQEEFKILNLLLQKRQIHISTDNEVEKIASLYVQLKEKASATDPTLEGHVEAIWKAAAKKLKALSGKMDRAQRHQLAVESSQIHQLKSELFPANNLQERIENFSSFFARLGPAFFDQILNHSKGFEAKYALLYESEFN